MDLRLASFVPYNWNRKRSYILVRESDHIKIVMPICVSGNLQFPSYSSHTNSLYPANHHTRK